MPRKVTCANTLSVIWYNISSAPVAQWIRALVFGTRCRRFESYRVYHRKSRRTACFFCDLMFRCLLLLYIPFGELMNCIAVELTLQIVAFVANFVIKNTKLFRKLVAMRHSQPILFRRRCNSVRHGLVRQSLPFPHRSTRSQKCLHFHEYVQDCDCLEL